MGCKITIDGVIKTLADTSVSAEDINKLYNSLKASEGLDTHFEVNTKSNSKLYEYLQEGGSELSIEKDLKQVITSFVNTGISFIEDGRDITLMNPNDDKGIDNGWQSVIRYFMRPGKIKYYKVAKDGTKYEHEKEGYNLSNAVASSTALVANDWLLNSAIPQSAKYRSDDVVRMLLGMDRKDIVTLADREAVSNMDGFVSAAANEIGNKVYKMLGIKAKADTEFVNNKQIENTLKTELGLLVLKALEYNGDIVLGKITLPTKGEVSVYRLLHNNKNGLGVAGKVIKNENSIGTQVSNKVNEVLNNHRVVGVYTDKKDAVPSRSEIKNNGVTGTVGEVSKYHKDAVIKQSGLAHKFKKGYIKALEALEDTFKEYMGYSDENGVLRVRKEAVTGKNLMIDMAYDNLFNAVDTVGYDKNMYARWQVITNNRFMIDSNQLNWQDKKLHRYAVTDSEVEVTGKLVDNFHMMLAQSFDFDIDKMESKDILADRGKNSIYAYIQDVLSKVELSENNGEPLEEYYESEAFKNDVKQVFEIVGNTGEPEHALSGVVELLGYLHETEAGRVYKTQSKIETDAITSGYAIKGLMFPFHGKTMETTWRELQKVGVFKQSSKFKSYGQWKAEGNKDSYEEPAEKLTNKLKMSGKLDNPLIKLIDPKSTVDGLTRSFMKNPFMVLNYGSAISSIVRSVGKKAEDNFYSMVEDYILHDADNRQQIGKIVREIANAAATREDGSIDKQSATRMYNHIRSMLVVGNIDFKLSKKETKALRTAVENLIADELTTVFEEKYGNFIKITKVMNEALTLQFRIGKELMDKRIEEIYQEKLKKVNGNTKLVPPITEKELLGIINELKDVFPTMNTALDTDEGDPAVMLLAKMQKVSGQEVKGNVGTTGVVRGKGTKLNSAASEVYRLVESYSSGAVIPIHFFDASIQAKLLSKYEALGVHDANYSRIDQVEEVTKYYNKEFWELARNYSLAKELYESTLNSVNKLNDDIVQGLSKYDTEDSRYADKIQPLVESVKTLYTAAEKRREELFTTPVRVEQAYYDGAAYEPADLSYKKKVLKAIDHGMELNEVYISEEEYTNIKNRNDAYKKKYPNMFVEGEEFEYDPKTGIITVIAENTHVDKYMKEVYTAHEIKHAITYEWLQNNIDSTEVKYLLKSLDTLKDYDPGRDYMKNLLADRLKYASSRKSDLDRVAELVAILASEPNIRKEFMKEFPQKEKTMWKVLIDTITKLFKKADMNIDTSYVINVVDSIVERGITSFDTIEYGTSIRHNIVDKQGNTVAFVSVSKDSISSPVVYLNGIGTIGGNEKMGYATAALNVVLDTYGDKEIMLEAVPMDDDTSLYKLEQWYGKRGFKVVRNGNEGTIMVRKADRIIDNIEMMIADAANKFIEECGL